MWLAAFAVIVLGVFALDRALKHYRPDAYRVFSQAAWTVEGLFIALALFGLIYTWYTGKLLFAPN